MPRQTIAPTFPSFKKISLGFIILALVLLVFIIYFSFAKATIILTLREEPKTLSFDLTVSATSTEGNLVARFLSQELEIKQEFNLENYQEKPGIAKGKIEIINNHTKNQSLVKTTRFLSPKGTLFRLQNNVLVPAGGEIFAEVYADKSGQSGNVGPTKWTIPGLSVTLQEKIYGVSSEPMTGGIKKIGILTQSNLDKAKQKFQEQLNSQIKNKLESESKEKILEKLIKSEVLAEEISQKLGEEVENFAITAKVLSKVILLEEEKLLAIAKEIYKQKNLEGQVLNWQIEDFDYSIKEWQDDNKATLEVKLTALVSSSFDPAKFDKSEITGFDKKGVEYYFSQYPSIKEIEVKFSPFWVKSVPALKDRVEIEIKK